MTYPESRAQDRARLMLVLDSVLPSFPHLRLCQLIANATGRDDNFYVEDGALCDALLDYERHWKEPR